MKDTKVINNQLIISYNTKFTGESMYLTDIRTEEDWMERRPLLIQSDDELLWRKAYIDFFWGRVDSRYLQPIATLRETDTYMGYGFTIMTVLCSLIEFIESTYNGKVYRFCNDNQLGPYEYNKSKKCFLDFLVTKKPFRDKFDDRLALNFYMYVRCGLLHEASTKDGWRILGKSDTGTEIICSEQKKVFRDDFESAIKCYLNFYVEELINDKNLQQGFIRKIDSLCSTVRN